MTETPEPWAPAALRRSDLEAKVVPILRSLPNVWIELRVEMLAVDRDGDGVLDWGRRHDLRERLVQRSPATVWTTTAAARLRPAPQPANGYATCTAGACVAACNPGYRFADVNYTRSAQTFVVPPGGRRRRHELRGRGHQRGDVHERDLVRQRARDDQAFEVCVSGEIDVEQPSRRH
jgi:hypothetical protein